MCSILIVTIASLAAAERSADAIGPDDKLLQGRWEYISVRYDGQPFPLEKGDYITISGRNCSIHRNGLVIKAKYALDPDKTPKQMDSVVARDDASFRLKQIYRLDGDKLTLCEPATPEAPRPTTFSAEKGEKQFLVVLKRSNIKAKQPERPSPQP